MFGIGAGEFFLILMILLVVVGPERLPQFARQAGRTIVQVRNWILRSPDAAMVLRARQEIERELESLRADLLEVQNARDEVIAATKEINKTIKDDVVGEAGKLKDSIAEESKQAIAEVKSAPGTVGRQRDGSTVVVSDDDKNTIAPPEAPISANKSEDSSAADVNGTSAVDDREQSSHITTDGNEVSAVDENSAGEEQTASITDTLSPSNEVVESPEKDLPEVLPGSQEAIDTAKEKIDSAEIRLLREQLRALSTDMQSLREILMQRGLLDDTDWQPTTSQISDDTAVITGMKKEERE
ncbi:MAG: twin-arginine translocase TatA/TatE family subunit [Chloroflexota bacterium]